MSTTLTVTTPSKTQQLHQRVTDTIINQLENGVVPWQQPWKGENSLLNGLPFNTKSKKRYTGVNILLLWAATHNHSFLSNEWGTFNHWKAVGEYIRKGEGKSATMIVKYGKAEKEVDGEIIEIPYLRSFWVYNRCQLQSWTPSENQRRPLMPAGYNIERHVSLEAFVDNLGAKIIHHNGGAYYYPDGDKVMMPVHESFTGNGVITPVEAYFSTLLHELTHWSGAPHRLNRTKGKRFGDDAYAYEELVAELGSAFLCAQHDISTVQKGDHASYIDNWIKVLKNNKQMLITAAADASKAYDFLNSLQPAN